MGERTDAVTGGRTDEIRRDIAQTQREMSRTIDEIQHRLSPHYMMQRSKEQIREAGVNASRGLMDRVRSNPIGAAMVGVGLWMLMRDSGRSGYDVEFIPDRMGGWDATGTRYSAAGEYRDLDYEGGQGRLADARERLSGAAESARERVSGAADSVRERANEMASSARHGIDVAAERARRLRMEARYRMDRAGHQSRDLLENSPLVVGLAAVAAGAILGALIPETAKEHELMGEQRDRMAERARQMAREGMDRARHVARTAADAATEAARNELQSDGERSPRTDVGTNIGIDRPQV
jgi:hypothetical protein